MAGLEVLRILNEPTAAALAYGHGRALNSRIAVFDMGGGTFDLSVLAVRRGRTPIELVSQRADAAVVGGLRARFA